MAPPAFFMRTGFADGGRRFQGKARTADKSMDQAVEKPLGGVGGAAAPPTSIRIRRLCRRGGLLILLAKSIPYNFGRPLVGRSCFLEKVAEATFSTRWMFQINIWFHNLQAIQQGWGRKSPGGKAGTAALLNRNRRREAAAIGGAERFGKSPGRAEAFASIHSDSIEKTLCCLSVWERGNLAGAKSSTLARTQGINFR